MARFIFSILVAGIIPRSQNRATNSSGSWSLPEKLDEWFMAGVVQSLLDAGMVLGKTNATATRFRPCWAARLEVANIEPTDIAVHQGILSQIHEQTRNLPEGTKINKVLIDGEEP